MIFEFLKRLFWKADEGSRKRKTSTSVFNTEDHELNLKKHCHGIKSHDCVKIMNEIKKDSKEILIQENSNDQPQLSLNLKQCKKTSTYSKPLKMLDSSKHFSQGSVSSNGTAVISSHRYLSKEKYESLTQSMLYETHRLTERKQYSEMLLNFIPPEKQKFNKEVESNDIEIINLNDHKNPSFDCVWYNNSEILKNSCDKSSIFSSKRPLFKAESLISVIDSKIDLKDKKAEKQLISRSIPIEIIKTNTLREKFSNKEVMKEDFVYQVTRRYNQRMEQRCKEAEDLKKMTYILAKHNQSIRESALESHLNRSMRLSEVVLDESLIVQQPKLPDITQDMMKKIMCALSSGYADETLVQEFGLNITRKDIQTLSGLNWLNDEIINFYMNLLITRSNSENYPTVYAMNTFFYPKLVSGGHASLKRWTRKIDLFTKDLIVVPIHLGIHWCLSVIDFRNKSINYYDSMGSSNYKCLHLLKQYLYDESIDKKNKSIDFLDWNFECMKDIPQQMNSSDCGVFSCMFAEYICANKNFNFSQEDMPYFRNKMIYEILTVQIL